MKDVNIEQFKRDSLEFDLYKISQSDVSEKIKQYDLILRNMLDVHTPEKNKKIAMTEKRPWMSEKTANAKTKIEIRKKIVNTKLNVHREACKRFDWW